jgi:hypothetical protein
MGERAPWEPAPRSKEECEREEALFKKCLAVQISDFSDNPPRQGYVLPVLVLAIGALLIAAGLQG